MTLQSNHQAGRPGHDDLRPDPTRPLPEPPTANVLDDIAHWAHLQPDHPALDDGTTQRTYAELWHQSETLAQHLAAQGVKTATPVLIWGPRSTAYAIATLAALRAGAVAVPASTMLPDARCASMAAEAAATHAICITTTPAWATNLITLEIDHNANPTTPQPKATPQPPGEHATIFFTSGTTGTPKAVLGKHTSLSGLAQWYREAFAIGPHDRVSMTTNVGFVVTLRNLFAPLTAGATVCIAPDIVLPDEGLQWVRDSGVTVLNTTPTTASIWLRDATGTVSFSALRWTLFGGEPLTGEAVDQWRRVAGSSTRVANVYGSTELGSARGWFEVPLAPTRGPLPIGRPIPGTEFLLRDARGRDVEVGELGELIVRARNLPSGYVNDAESTHDLFRRTPGSPHPDDRQFRTGDLGRRDDDGNLHLIGRRDDQVKIGGFRVELLEVGSVIRQHPNVAEAHVFPTTAGDGSPTLAAFVTTHDTEPDETTLVAAMRRISAAQLPLKAVPGEFYIVDHVPVGTTGKVDRQALLAFRSQRGRPGHDDLRPDPTRPLPEPPTANVLDDIAHWAHLQPDHPALDDGTTQRTYAELWHQSETLAQHLAAQGVKTATPVLIWGPRSTAYAIATLAALRAGAVAVPASTMLPDARCASMAAEAAATHAICITTTPAWATNLITLEIDHNANPTTPQPKATPQPPGEHATIFFTSGTTGTPKAVLGKHTSLAYYLSWWRQEFEIGPHDRVSMATSTAFDVTLRNLFGPLSSGATVCIAPEGLLPEDGWSWLCTGEVTVLHVTPSLANSWLNDADVVDRTRSRSLRWTLFAGEMLTDTLVRRWRDVNPGRVGNMYGPTETTMSRCLYVVPDEPTPGAQPVGLPLPGTQVLVVDDNNALCEIDQPGEVLVRTRSGTAGYLNNAVEQATRFVPNPFTGDLDDIVYRTGDVGVYQSDGTLRLVGRTDDQVKIGGVRVEPGEIASALVRFPGIRAAHVHFHADLGAEDGGQLVAFIAADIATELQAATSAALRRHCGTLLVPAAIPRQFVFVERLPMTPNGKVDRARLAGLLNPAGPLEGCATAPVAVDPRTAPDPASYEISIDELVQLWRDVLRRDDIGPDSNFFEVGGTSVGVVRLADRLSSRVVRQLTLHDLFEAQTPRELATLLAGTSASALTNAVVDVAVVDVVEQPSEGAPVHVRVHHLASTTPDAPAITDGETTLTYRALDERVAAIAAALRAAGVAPDSLVAVHATRRAAIIPVLLGIHRAGGGYVPIDPDLPKARVAMLVDDCAPAVVISDRPLPDVGHSCPVVDFDTIAAAGTPTDGAAPFEARPDTAAYVIYTSGSTGMPKGVLISQGSLASYVDAVNEHYGIRSDDRVLQYHSLSFDSSVEEIFTTLAAGATLVVPSGSLLGSAGWFADLLDDLAVTVIGLPTAFWSGLTADLDDANLDLPERVRTVIIGGQAARSEVVTQWNRRLGKSRSLFNAYGPTEVTIAATIADLTGAGFATGEPVPIGNPLSRVDVLVVDDDDQPVGTGQPGELLLGGVQVAMGYHRRSELTAERFVTDPTGATSGRFYRTGDRVREGEDGQLVFEGRLDDQVKIRGFRIELGEIESVFESHPEVREAVALVGGAEDDPTLCVHVVLRDGASVSVEELRAHAAIHLPPYAVPARIERRHRLPRTPGGKPDRRALRNAVRAPLGFAQEQQWFLYRLDPQSAAYNMTFGLRLRGPLDPDVLDQALSDLVERHEALRTRYVDDDDSVVQIIDDPVVVRAERMRLDASPGDDLDAAARRHQLRLGGTHFDLEDDLLFRPVLTTIGVDDHLLTVRSHHIAIDGWSVEVLIREFTQRYALRRAGQPLPADAPAVQPRHLAEAQRRSEADGRLDRLVDHWEELLTPLPESLALPFDRPRPPERDTNGALVTVSTESTSGSTLTRTARDLRTTPFAIGLALFTEYLAARCDQSDFIVGIPSADRDEPGSDEAVAMLVNTLPHRVRSRPAQSFRETVAGTTGALRDALAHKGAPLDRIVRRLRPPRTAGVHPLFQVTFQTMNAPAPLPVMGDVAVEAFSSNRTGAKFDVSLNLVVGETIECKFTFARDVFDESTMNEIARGFAAFVDVALLDVDQPVESIVASSAATPMQGAATPLPPRAATGPTTDSATNDTTLRMQSLFSTVLGTEVGPDDDFFASGGHSLLAVRLCSLVDRELGARLPLAIIFESPTPRGLAGHVAPPSPVTTDSALTAAPAGARAPLDPGAVADLLAMVVDAFGQTLGAEVGPDDDFFASGGHSLLAVRLCSRIERTLGRPLAVASVFDARSPRAIARLLAGGPREPAIQEKPARVAESSRAEPAASRVVPDELTRPVRLWLSRSPMSLGQRQLWMADQLGTTGNSYILTSAFDVYGDLRLDLLARAIEATGLRHEVLRTRYVVGHGDFAEQVIDAEPQGILELHDLRGAEMGAERVNAEVRGRAERPFRLAEQHCWRIVAARVADGHHVVALAIHHIATDAESQGIIQRDLVRAYNALIADGCVEFDPPALQFADHAVWQHAQIAGGQIDADVSWWVDRLSPTPEPLQLPAMRHHPGPTANTGDEVTLRGGSSRRARLDAYARQHKTTPFVVALSAYQILLHRITGRTDLIVGIPVSERGLHHDADTVGFFVTTLPVRVTMSGDMTSAEVLAENQRAISDVLTHSRAPLERIVDSLEAKQRGAGSSLIQTMFSMQSAGGTVPQFEGLLTKRRPVHAGRGTAKFDLSLIVSVGDDLDFWFEYRDEVYDHETVRGWGDQFLNLFDAMLDDSSRSIAELPVVDPDVEQWLTKGCNRTRREYPREATVTELFAQIADAYPDRVAIVQGPMRLTYGQLREQAESLSSRLTSIGVGSGDRVLVRIGRSAELIVAMLATLGCGAAYVPIDPGYPQARQDTMQGISRASAIIDRRLDGPSLVVHPIDVEPTGNDQRREDGPMAPAYVMFTSGSTGRPKGVVVPHRGIVRLVRNADYLAFGDEVVIAHLSNTSFDAATFEIWGALLNGGRLVVLDTDTVTSPSALRDSIRDERITSMFVTTALFNVVARETPDAFSGLRDLLFGGEAADVKAVHRVLAAGPPQRLLNVYGPTESTTFSSWQLIDRLDDCATSVPIGRPVANTTLHVVDMGGRPVPPLVEGELVIGGDGLALGYLDDQALTEARFVPDPFSADPAARLYRSGDIVRRRLDGTIEFVGRRDHQVKIRGFRIELGDIEAALCAVDGVEQSHVMVHRRNDGDAEVVAYVVAADHTGDVLRTQLAQTLPAYLVPSAVMVLEEFPLNANGKIDVHTLPRPTLATKPHEPTCAPVDAVEAQLLTLWRQSLDNDMVGVDDNFFEAGGTSIRAVRLFAAIERAFDVRLALSLLFESATVRDLAACLRNHGATVATPQDPPIPVHGIHRPPAVNSAERFVNLRTGDAQRHPVYCVHPAGGQVFAYASLLPHIALDQPVIGINEYGWGDASRRLDSVEAYAEIYVDEIERHRPAGPIVLAGYSLGGLIAFEMARQLVGRGRDVPVLLLLDATPAAAADPSGRATPVSKEPNAAKLKRRIERDGIRGVCDIVGRTVERNWSNRIVDPIATRRDRIQRALAEHRGRPVDPLLLGRESERAGLELRNNYRPQVYGGRVVCFTALGIDPDFPIADYSHRWHRWIPHLEVIGVPGNHSQEGSMLTPPHSAVLGKLMHQVLAGLDEVDNRGGARTRVGFA